MKLHAWQVSSLAPVECYLPPDLSSWSAFSHVSTTVRGALSGDDTRLIGDTVWAGVCAGREVALAWDWVELMPGVVCQLDPNSITTNVRFLDEHDCYQEPLQAIISANRLTHHWPWQAAVVHHLPSFADRSADRRQPVARGAMSRVRTQPSRVAGDLRRAA